ncbi:ABC transporter ATP-binding protein [Thermodesulfobacteriota bacterium]
MSETNLLEVEHLSKLFPFGKRLLREPKAWIRAVDTVSFSVRRGESFGLVGESGCGKTTLGRLILRLINPTSGKIVFDGCDITDLSKSELRPFRSRMQIIFQDPYSSLDPRMKVKSIVTEPLGMNRDLAEWERRDIVSGLLQKVGLKSADLDKYPHEFSGGQRQRIGIARALCVRPDLIVADEPVSALDVSIQAQVINLMEDLKNEFNLSYIFISHDLSIICHVCERIAVMYFGSIIEMGPTDRLSISARHPYTRALLSAAPIPDPHRLSRPLAMEGDVPSPIDPPKGCPFHPRCAHQFERCQKENPQLTPIASDHLVACWLNEGRGFKGENS